MGEPTDKAALASAAMVMFAWAKDEVICEGCVPKANREPGCFSCDSLRFFEAVADSLADYEHEETDLHKAIRALSAEDKDAPDH